MSRITPTILDGQLRALTALAGTPAAPYVDGKAQVGADLIDRSYGGAALHQIVNDQGGERDVLEAGYQSAGTLSLLIRAYANGYRDALRRQA